MAKNKTGRAGQSRAPQPPPASVKAAAADNRGNGGDAVPNDPAPPAAPRSEPRTFGLFITQALPLGNGDRPAGFKLATITIEDGVDPQEVHTLLRNPQLIRTGDA